MSKSKHVDDATGTVVRFGDVVEHGGHAWVLAHDDTNWFYECLKCRDRAHVLSIEDMKKAVEHNYAYMPLRHRAPWSKARTVTVLQADGQSTEEQDPPYPPCPNATAPLPDVTDLQRGPVVAVPRGD